MVVIPAGEFMMGSPPDEPERKSDEGPQHLVEIKKFALATTEITFDQWQACFDDRGCSHLPHDEGWGRANSPVMNVSWNDAREYVIWLSRKTNEAYRLPSESEWEWAARAGSTTYFNTGDVITTDQANFNGDVFRSRTVPVGSFAANEFGLFDMHGNVYEYVQDCYSASYNGAPSDGSAWLLGNCDRVVLRGGSWTNSAGRLRSAARYDGSREYRESRRGFRVARDL